VTALEARWTPTGNVRAVTPVASWRFSATRRTVVKGKKWTPEEWRAWRAAREARLRELRRCIARIDAELAARGK
jgi:hypothetical protein